MAKKVSVLVGAGSIGQAIIRRVSAGKHVVLADYSLENAERAAKTLENAGFECSTIKCDLGSKDDILKLVEFATSKGEVMNVMNAAVYGGGRHTWRLQIKSTLVKKEGRWLFVEQRASTY